MSDKLYTISLKGSTANQPWVVINANDANELRDALDALGDNSEYGDSLYQRIADANALYQGVANVANPAQHQPASAPAPQAAAHQQPVPQAAFDALQQPNPAGQNYKAAQQQTGYGRRKASAGTGGRGGQSERLAPGVVPEPCHHGARTFRDGNGAKGYWSAYFCPSPKGTPDQCAPLWVDND